MTTLEEVILQTQQTIESILTKPKCTKKLLSKPPFRFLHDIVTGVRNITGFPENYFTPHELNSMNFNDKASKVAFIEKLIRLVSIGVGEVLPTKASKVVSGAEPLLTNLLITEYARLAVDGDIDREAIIARCLDEGELQINMNEDPIPSTITLQSSDVNHYITSKVHACTGEVEDTKNMIASVISKPKCTEKLLLKPPFRFIHDVIIAIHKETDVLQEGLLTNDEFDSSHFTNKDVKIEFLSKIVTSIKIRLGNIDINLKPSKVVAGLETKQTRRFLQLFVLAATAYESSEDEPARELAQQKSQDNNSEEEKDSNRLSRNEAKRLQTVHINRKEAVDEPTTISNKSDTYSNPEPKEGMEYEFQLNKQYAMNNYKLRDMSKSKHKLQSLDGLASCIQELVSSTVPIGNFLDNCPRYLNDLNKISDKNEEEYNINEAKYVEFKSKFDREKSVLMNKIREIEDETNDINLEIIDLGKNSDLIQESMQRFRNQ